MSSNVKTPSDISFTDRLAIKLSQTKALLMVGSDADFSSYHPSVQRDFLGAVLERVEEMECEFPTSLTQWQKNTSSE